jgi:hypothetical protein
MDTDDITDDELPAFNLYGQETKAPARNSLNHSQEDTGIRVEAPGSAGSIGGCCIKIPVDESQCDDLSYLLNSFMPMQMGLGNGGDK